MTSAPRTGRNGYAGLPGGFRLPAGSQELRMEKVIDRALLALVISRTPGYLTVGGIPRAKTRKQREIEQAELDQLVRLMVNDLGIYTAGGWTEPAVEWQLRKLAVERGLLTYHPGDPPEYRVADDHRPWALREVMSDERKDREYPRRQAARERSRT